MSPRPEQVGESCLLEREMVQDLADLIDKIVSSAGEKVGAEFSLFGFIFENTQRAGKRDRESLMHILVEGVGLRDLIRIFALGGKDFSSLFDLFKVDNPLRGEIQVNWGGQAGTIGYPVLSSGKFLPIEGLYFESMDRGHSETCGEGAIDLSDGPSSTREKLEAIGVSSVGSVQKIRAALEKAGMPK